MALIPPPTPHSGIPLKPGSVPQRRLQAVSSVLAALCLVLTVVLPLSVLTVGLLASRGVSTPAGQALTDYLTSSEISMGIKLLGSFLLVLPVSAIAFSLVRARACFIGFARGEYFTSSTVRALRGFAAGMATSQFLGIVVGPLSTLLMLSSLPPGKGKWAVNVDSHQLLFLLFAAMVWVIAGVMAKGEALAEENAQFV